MKSTGTHPPAVSTAPPPDLEYPPEWPVYSAEAIARVGELVARGRTFDYGYGAELQSLEQRFGDRHHRRYALALGSGTACLYAAFLALGIGPGDEVIVGDYTFFSAVTPLLLLGAVPVLADVDPVHGCLDPDETAALVGPRTVAILMTHLWGHPCPADELRTLADRHSLALVEDCSHAHGATYHGRPVGSLGDVAVFSIGGHKAVSGGMGGMLLTDDPDVYARACLSATFRHRTDLTIDAPGYQAFLETGLGGNARISPIAAVLAGSHLDDLDRRIAARQRNTGRLIDGLTDLPGLERVPVAPGCTTGAWYDGVIACSPVLPRDVAVRVLTGAGLKVRAPSTRPVHQYPVFTGSIPAWSPLLAAAARAATAVNDRPFPQADRLAGQWVKLPVGLLWDDAGLAVEPGIRAATAAWHREGLG